MTTPHSHATTGTAHPFIRIGLALLALAIATAIGLAIGEIAGLTTAAHNVGKSPFGVGISEGGGPPTGIIGLIMALQDQFSHAMIAGLSALRGDNEALWPLVGIGFAYGVFHAAGPGHGKAIIATYAFSRERALGRTLAMAAAAALLQGLVAIALVGGLALVLHATATTLRQTASDVEIVSFALMALYGAVLLWRKTGPLAKAFVTRPASDHAHHDHAHDHDHDHDHHHHHHDHDHDHGSHGGAHAHQSHAHEHDAHEHDAHCGHTHAPVVPDHAGLREMAAAVFAAGIRPCSGSILMLVFAFSQGLIGAGLAAALAIAAGTGLTTSLLATFSILARSAAQKLATRASNQSAALLITSLETLAAAFVAALGLGLILASLAGQWPISG
jgi:ABC-type nickel/cobalt efflux system permease component RcnA